MTYCVVYGDDKWLVPWAEKRIGLEPFSQHAHGIGLALENGELVAVAVFDRFTSWGCEISIAAEGRRWVRAEFCRCVAAYAFVQLRLERLTCQIEASNKRSLIFAHAMGFREEGRLRRLDPAHDVRIFGMLRHECRYVSALDMRER